MNEQQHDWRPPIGARVMIVGNHPAAGQTGTVYRHDSWMGRPAVAVRLDNGLTPGVQHPRNLMLLGGKR